MPGRIFVTCAAGFVGAAVVDELLSRGYGVHGADQPAGAGGSGRGAVFCRRRVRSGGRRCGDGWVRCGRSSGRDHLREPVGGRDVRSHSYAGARAIVEAAQRRGVKRFVHMSALGTRQAPRPARITRPNSRPNKSSNNRGSTGRSSARRHSRAGRRIHEDGSCAGAADRAAVSFHALFRRRPDRLRRGGFASAGLCRRCRPAFVDALDKPLTKGEIYPLVGPDRFTWPEFHNACAMEFVGHKRWVMPMPVWVALTLAAVLPSSLLGFNRDQILMSQEDNTADSGKFTRQFGWPPRAGWWRCFTST